MLKKISFIIMIAFPLAGALLLHMLFYSGDAAAEECRETYADIHDNIQSGGPPKDGIPAVDEPVFISADSAGLQPGARVYGVDYNGFTAAFPDSVMVWHEIANFTHKSEQLSLTYCPLTRSAIGYKGYNLGVSGRLVNSNLIMYDRKTDSFIPQILGIGIDGPLCGKKLETFPVVATTWKNWRAAHPKTRVLSEETGHSRDYGRDPYEGYYESPRTMFPVMHTNDSLHPKTKVVGIKAGDAVPAVVKDGFKERHPNGFGLGLAGRRISLDWNDELQTVSVRSDGDVTAFEVFWFAWHAYYPKAKVVK